MAAPRDLGGQISPEHQALRSTRPPSNRFCENEKNDVTQALCANEQRMGVHIGLPLPNVKSSGLRPHLHDFRSFLSAETWCKSSASIAKPVRIMIRLENISKQNGHQLLFIEASATLLKGEKVGLVGPNGAGKTTTLKLLSGVINPTRGSARVMGFIPWKRENAYRRRFALIMGQKNQLWWDLPARESFRLHQQIYRIPPTEFDRTFGELTELLSIGSLLNQPVRELSLGERMKMELTAALLHSPEVLFLDEPTIGLDVVAQHKIQQFLRFYQRERKITILLTSHYMKDVIALCQRVVIIAQGVIKYDGSLAGIIDRFSSFKVVTLQLSEDAIPSDFDAFRQYGQVLETQPPKVRLRIPRPQVPKTLAEILARHTVEDVAVEDPPLEEVIAEMFELVAKSSSV